jgi:ribosomal protein S18 acetylase RimI-like enzyme
MIEAYRGTIDYDDETVEDALGEVQTYLAGGRGGRPLLDDSRLAFAGPHLVGACLAGEWKNRGVGEQLLRAVLSALREQGHQEVRAVITEDNVPSERLLGRIGFQKISAR